jgi:hypothetical protein
MRVSNSIDLSFFSRANWTIRKNPIWLVPRLLISCRDIPIRRRAMLYGEPPATALFISTKMLEWRS